MIALVIAADALIAAACAAGLVLLAWLLHRDRGQFWRPPPGGPRDRTATQPWPGRRPAQHDGVSEGAPL